MMLLYQAGIKFYGGLIFLASTFYSKANLWIQGRKNWRNILSKKYPQQKKVIWFHCASVGEFEQGRPLIEKIKINHPDYFILLTFFSPSVFELRKNYPFADFICYLPLDTKKNAKDFISLVNPELVIFVKYEIWLNFLFELKERNIPTILISAYFNEKSNFFKGFLKYLYSEAFQSFIIIFTQDKATEDLFKSENIKNQCIVAGDTRFDRVLEQAQKSFSHPVLELMTVDSDVIVCGSTWPSDRIALSPLIQQEFPEKKWIIVPHELHETDLKAWEQLLPGKTCRLSGWKPSDPVPTILLYDKMGDLALLYRYGKVNFVGGGFYDGIHNLLEAIVYGSPVVFGPKYQRFKEAFDLINLNIGFSVKNPEELKIKCITLLNSDLYAYKSAILEYFETYSGATDKIYTCLLNEKLIL